MFRTSVPGHFNCFEQPAPFSNYSQFLHYQDVESDYFHKFGWEKVEGFNAYAEVTWLNQSNTNAQSRGPSWHLLDVFPMTVLRPDGHSSSSDCLHYSLRGPPDWWNRLLYSNLLDIATLD